jgi:sortase A
MIARRLTLVAGAGLVCLGLWQLLEGGWIHAKAALAGHLVTNAWSETLAGARKVRPWPWADTWPVARLQFATLKREMPVLAGASGSSLAFGPGHLDGTALPGTPGTSVIAGHRDTSFAFLGDLNGGDAISVQGQDGRWREYRVTRTAIADARLPWHTPMLAEGKSAITLVTCWPLDAIIPGGPLRYLVYAEEAQKR